MGFGFVAAVAAGMAGVSSQAPASAPLDVLRNPAVKAALASVKENESKALAGDVKIRAT